DRIAVQTGIGHAVVGMVLLSAVTSLPELAVAITAALKGLAALTVNNLLGSAAMQIALLAVADAVLIRRALTHVVAKPSVLLQGALAILMLSLVAGGVITGNPTVFGIGLWSWGILAVYLAGVY